MQIYNFNTAEFNGVKAESIFKDRFSKEIKISMQKGTFMKEHCAPNPIKVQILKGCVEFSAENNTAILNELDMIALCANVKHSLKAKENSIIRLTLYFDDDFARVQSILK